MTITVKIGEARSGLPDLIAQVEGGQEVIFLRGNEPVARLTRISSHTDVAATIDDIRRNRADPRPNSVRDILAWRDEGRS